MKGKNVKNAYALNEKRYSVRTKVTSREKDVKKEKRRWMKERKKEKRRNDGNNIEDENECKNECNIKIRKLHDDKKKMEVEENV